MVYPKAKTSSTRPATAATLFLCVLIPSKSFALFYQILGKHSIQCAISH
jgi:hypothetical protein